MFERAKNTFESYIKSYDLSDEQIELKYVHSYRVVDLMEKLAIRLGLDKEKIEISKIIGLLHDIGRFEQIRKFNTISDLKTNTDHADESCVYLFDKGHIRDFIESNKYDSIIYEAIKNHNKLAIKDGLNAEELLFSKMIRDMDKVDIYKSVLDYKKLFFDINEVTKEVLDTYLSDRSIDVRLLKTKSDWIILYLSFISDFNFKQSVDVLTETGNIDMYLNKVEVEPNSRPIFEELKEVLMNRIDNWRQHESK